MIALREAKPTTTTLTRRLGPLTLGIVALAGTSGCSWIFVQPLPAEHGYRDGYQSCTTSRVAPAFDTIFTLTNLASALYVASENNVSNKGEAVTLGVSVAVIWALSAGYGFSHTAECEAAQEDAEGGYRPPPHLRAPPRYYPQPPPRVVAPPPPTAPQEATPPSQDAAPSPRQVAPQQKDDDDPGTHSSPEPSSTSPSPRTPKKPGERLDAPRFGG
jgi:hypothetical protein